MINCKSRSCPGSQQDRLGVMCALLLQQRLNAVLVLIARNAACNPRNHPEGYWYK